MKQMFIFGLGYTAKQIAAALERDGWRVEATGRNGSMDFDDFDRVRDACQGSTHIISSVPPEDVTCGDDVLVTYGAAVRDAARKGAWIGYLSSTGVYGDARGAWVDESSPTGGGRRSARTECDARWLDLEARVFRLPGIYGPGRSALDRVRIGRANRIDIPGQVFSRVHVDDIVSGVLAALHSDAPAGAYNLGDDLPCSQNEVIEEACRLLGQEPPPLQTLEEANLSEMAMGFYAENRRVANGKAKRLLGWEPKYPTFKEGLAALL